MLLDEVTRDIRQWAELWEVSVGYETVQSLIAQCVEIQSGVLAATTPPIGEEVRPLERVLCTLNHNMWCWNTGALQTALKWIRSTSITWPYNTRPVGAQLEPGPRDNTLTRKFFIRIEVRTNSELSVISREVFNDNRGRTNITKLSKRCW